MTVTPSIFSTKASALIYCSQFMVPSHFIFFSVLSITRSMSPQFEYMAQHLVFANCIPLILKFFNQNIMSYITAKNRSFEIM